MKVHAAFLAMLLASATPGAAAVRAQPQAQPAAVGASAQSGDETAIGTIQTVKGQAFILRGGQRLPVARGTRLRPQDVIRTEKGAAVGFVLRDETAISLGPSSELALREFVYKPNEGLFASVVRFARGTMVYVAGRIAKLAPSAIRVETPVGVAAARGTKFLVAIPE